jgi:hypothetical protein
MACSGTALPLPLFLLNGPTAIVALIQDISEFNDTTLGECNMQGNNGNICVNTGPWALRFPAVAHLLLHIKRAPKVLFSILESLCGLPSFSCIYFKVSIPNNCTLYSVLNNI